MCRIRASAPGFSCSDPLAEIAPDLRDPVTGKSVADLLRQLLRDETCR